MSNNLIPTNGGKNPVNGLDIQSVACVVFDRGTLEILKVEATHNRADEEANWLFRLDKVDAIAGEVRFHKEGLRVGDLVGMHLHQFEHFVENNSNHPLCKKVLDSQLKVQVITVSNETAEKIQNKIKQEIAKQSSGELDY